MQVNLQLTNLSVDYLFSGNGSSSTSTRYDLGIFFGDTYRTTDAKVVKLAEGEDAPALDITVRLSEFHTLGGSVLAADGHVANAAKVALLWKDSKDLLVSTEVRAEDNSFHFDYVPDGEYTLHITDARDVTRQDIPNCPRCIPPFHTEEKTVRTFGNTDQPIVLHTDVQSLAVTVPGDAPK